MFFKQWFFQSWVDSCRESYLLRYVINLLNGKTETLYYTPSIQHGAMFFPSWSNLREITIFRAFFSWRPDKKKPGSTGESKRAIYSRAQYSRKLGTQGEKLVKTVRGVGRTESGGVAYGAGRQRIARAETPFNQSGQKLFGRNWKSGQIHTQKNGKTLNIHMWGALPMCLLC